MKRLLLVVVLLVAAGCGSTTPAIDASGKLIAPETVSSSCAEDLGGLTDALFEMDSRLSVGLTYPAYGEKLADARVAYDKVKFSDLELDCIAGAGQPAEDAFNEYVLAHNTWKKCVDDTACANDSISTELQAHWSKATAILDAVKGRLP